MSSAATGSARERAVIRILTKLGYYAQRSPASKGVDVFGTNMAGHPPHVAVEAGGTSKRVAAAFNALKAHTLPAGTLLLLVKWVNRKAIWYGFPDLHTRHKTAAAAIEAAKRELM